MIYISITCQINTDILKNHLKCQKRKFFGQNSMIWPRFQANLGLNFDFHSQFGTFLKIIEFFEENFLLTVSCNISLSFLSYLKKNFQFFLSRNFSGFVYFRFCNFPDIYKIWPKF